MEVLNVSMAIISIILGIISIVMAINSKRESEKINRCIELKLIELQNISNYINKSSERIEGNLKMQVARIVNSNNPTQEEKLECKFIEKILPLILNNNEINKNTIEYK